MVNSSISIRPATLEDIPALREVFRSAVHQVAELAYSEEQAQSWAQFAEDPAFQNFIVNNSTVVAVQDQIVGFGGLGPDGHIASLYVAGNIQRAGVGSALLTHILQEARDRGERYVFVEASEFSRPLFSKFGFSLKEVETVERRGVLFERFVMHLPLTG
ncbi:MAG: GNAT family N-acetyltransferase [Rhodothermales bacterium]|nr:GNAT family N-acetyltransferase [Rhodothermales bacterium]